MTTVALSVLDLVPVNSRNDPAEALRFTTELARQAERWGYHRFWVAEHHNMPAIASSAPAVLIAHLAAATSTIRVGSGGVMLPNHAPLVVAEQFGTLEALHPGRIDLGVGRAPGTDSGPRWRCAGAWPDCRPRTSPSEFADLRAMLAGDPSRLRTVPTPAGTPQFWLLGSSAFSARWPASSACHSPSPTISRRPTPNRRWRCTGGPSSRRAALDRPYAMVAVNVVCADTDEHAHYLAAPGWLSFLALRSGRPIPLPTPEQAAEHRFGPAEAAFLQERLAGQAMGSPDTVRDQLTELLERTGADELMVTSQLYDLPDRLRSYRLVAELLDPVPNGTVR